MYYYVFFFPFDGDNIGNHGSFSSTAQAFGYYGKLLFYMNIGIIFLNPIEKYFLKIYIMHGVLCFKML